MHLRRDRPSADLSYVTLSRSSDPTKSEVPLPKNGCWLLHSFIHLLTHSLIYSF